MSGPLRSPSAVVISSWKTRSDKATWCASAVRKSEEAGGPSSTLPTNHQSPGWGTNWGSGVSDRYPEATVKADTITEAREKGCEAFETRSSPETPDQQTRSSPDTPLLTLGPVPQRFFGATGARIGETPDPL